MKSKSLLLVALFLLGPMMNFAQHNLLSTGFGARELSDILISVADFKPYPPIGDREIWDNISPVVKGFLIEKAENNTGKAWPSISATLMLEFVRNGNRSEYENISFSKRTMLIDFILAELAENKGRFMDDIIDGVWSICEESYWGVPAHLKHSVAGEGLVDVKEPFVDLFAAETARILALANYFLKEKFTEISPQISDRISFEIKQRVLAPVMARHHMWMDFSFNWNTWICESWMTTALLEVKDEKLRAETIAKIVSTLDNFLNPYPADGGCDEGPAYWNAAGGSLYECLYMLEKATGGKYSLWDNEKIRKIGEYIVKVRLTEEHILNFADAFAHSRYAPTWVYFSGEMTGNREMMAYGAEGMDNDLKETSFAHFNRRIELVLNYDKLKNFPARKPFPGDIWMDRIQVMVSRDFEGSDNGFVLAAKAGSNTESHNHNDVGSFVVYYNGYPALIDVGRGTYTARNFSNMRYSLWFNSSNYHNVPAINGIPQVSRAGTNARNVKYEKGDSGASLTADLAPAYPPEAGLVSLVRSVKLNRSKDVTVRDLVEFVSPGRIVENFMLCSVPDISKAGVITFKAGEDTLTMQYDEEYFLASCEKMKYDQPEDVKFRDSWGDIFRVSLTAKKEVKKGYYTFTLSK
jgi:hypothetical protein